ncbi:LysR family transcriptional regulator [Pseudorhodoferax sp.]|uniref:LysR family transcriptional regulator n=1 Tax=Pseudorhodoferax sp. TaxID=1993553 RepID=UPI002DD61CC4|nr:LysR family transcriptional regulator [Pseudorhodoferax sp.]
MDQISALRVFARVVEAGNFSRAADQLQMHRPSVSKLVQQLETHLKVKLLRRTTRRVTVTPEGAAYYERTKRVLTELDEIESDLTQDRTSPKGCVRVDVGSSVANLILMPQLPAFLQRYPEVRLALGVSDRPVDLVGEAVDCVIRGGAMTDQSLVARRIAQMAFTTVASPAYLKRHGVPGSPQELLDGRHGLVSYFSAGTGRIVPAPYVRAGERFEIAGQGAISVNESTAHLNAALTGLGLVQTFGPIVQPHLESGALVEVLAEWAPPPMPFYVAYPHNRHLSLKLRVFVDWVVQVFAPYNSRRGSA